MSRGAVISVTVFAVLVILLSLILFWQSKPQNPPVNDTISSLSTPPTMPTANPTPGSKAPQMSIDTKATYTATVTTTAGKFTLELNAAKTPVTVNNFVTLAKSGFYNGTIFHRSISGFMIQGGDPAGDGSGGPGYSFNDEPFEGEYSRGTLAMANAGPNTNGSQFFIMHQDYALPKNYVIFGKVTSGMDVVDKIATAPVTANAFGEMSKPVSPVKIISVDISEK